MSPDVLAAAAVRTVDIAPFLTVFILAASVERALGCVGDVLKTVVLRRSPRNHPSPRAQPVPAQAHSMEPQVMEQPATSSFAGPTTRAASKPKISFLPPIRISANLVSLALSAFRRGPPASPDDGDEDGEEPLSSEGETHAAEDSHDSVDDACDTDAEGVDSAAEDGTTDVPTVNLTRAEKRKLRSKLRKKVHRRKKRSRDAASRNQGDQARRDLKVVTLRALLRGKPVYLNVSVPADSTFGQSGDGTTPVFPVASSGYVGARYTATPAERNKSSLDDFKDDEFTVIEWDGKTPLPLLDSDGRVFAVLAGSPRDEAAWTACIKDATKAMQDLEREYRWPANSKPNRRGPHPSVTVGVSYGGGQKHPSNLAQGRNGAAVSKILKNPAIIRLAGFINSAFHLFAPDLHEQYATNLNNILKSDPTLRRPFDNSVFAAGTFNLGGNVATKIHLDHMNLATGWCGIVALGDYNPKLGGHLVLWDLKLVIEFPPGAVIFIPSAILRHSNVAVGEHETRMSFTQFSAGGLFRWEDCGFRSQKDFDADGLRHDKSGEERFRDGVARFGLWDELKASALERVVNV